MRLDCRKATRYTIMKTISLLSVVILSSCALIDDGPDNRTYPHAVGYDLVTIAELNKVVPLPGSYNVRGFAVDVPSCPEDALCIPTPGIAVFSRSVANPPEQEFLEEGIFIIAENLEQFEVGGRYEFSVRVDHERVAEAAWPAAVLVGYDRIR